MNLRSIFLATTALAVSVAPLSAQQLGAAAARSHQAHGFMRMLHSLNLSDQQKAQIKTMVQQYRQQHPQGSAPDHQARKALREQIMGVLTPAQKEKLRAEMKQPLPAPTPEETAQP